MQKKLLAVAVGAAMVAAPTFAQADVKLWGKLQVEVANIDGGAYDSETVQGDNNGMSRWGITASKDLGNGMKALGKMAWLYGRSQESADGIGRPAELFWSS